MNRRGFLKIAAAAMLLGCGPKSLSTRRRPNLLLIVSDTLRADHLGCYGAPMPLSPAVDALARRGALFTDVMSCAPLTGASHATLMTGAYQTRHGIVDNRGAIPTDLATLAEVLTDAGYRTGAFVSNGALKPSSLGGIERGFDPYDVELPAAERNRALSLYRIAKDSTAAATAWLEENGDLPFFLWVHYIEPHGPYELPEPDLLGQLTALPRIEGEPATLPVLEGNYQPGGIPAYQVLGEERDPRRYRLRYAARVRYMDRYVQQLLDAVGRLRSEDNTFVVFVADHGELLGEHGYYFMHGTTVLGPVLNIPLIVVGPGIQAGHRIPVPVSNVDIMPTILDLLRIGSGSVSEQMQGRSLRAVLQGEAAQARPIYALSKRTMESSVRLGSLKYVQSEGGKTGREGVFDIQADPAEQRDLARDRPGEAKQLRALLSEFTAQDPGVLTRSPDAAPRLNEEDRQRLEALGYL